MNELVLAIDEKSFGPEHPNVATSLSDLPGRTSKYLQNVPFCRVSAEEGGGWF
jgi:hypothetical protein